MEVYINHPQQYFKTEWFHNIKAMYYYELYFNVVRDKRHILVILFNDFSTQSFSYKDKEIMFTCIDFNYKDILLYELNNRILITLLVSSASTPGTGNNKVKIKLFYNIWKSLMKNKIGNL